MNTREAFARGQANRGRPERIFDWKRAAKIIRERKPAVAEAGLSEDWDWTGGVIWRNDCPVPKEETYTYLASNWATPTLDIDGERIPCFVTEGEDAPKNWNEHTYWPKDALKILGKK